MRVLEAANGVSLERSFRVGVSWLAKSKAFAEPAESQSLFCLIA